MVQGQIFKGECIDPGRVGQSVHSLRARPLRIWIELGDVRAKVEGHLSIYDHNPEESPKFNISLGFPGCYKDISVKVEIELILLNNSCLIYK